jgi:hypothetical protein
MTENINKNIFLFFFMIVGFIACGENDPEIDPGVKEPPTVVTGPTPVAGFNLQNIIDSTSALANPHKGWFHHYFDDAHIRYPIGTDSDITDFTGLSHLYFRIPWSELEVKDNEYNWEIIDKVVEKWFPKGITIGVQVTCKETYNVAGKPMYATPKWLVDSGAKGEMCFMADWGNAYFWEPDYADPIFLNKLDEFHAAFAARYDGKPYIEYIDMGSYGSWGEGHNWPRSERVWPVETIKKHFDIYAKHYKKSQLTLSDDWIYEHRQADQATELKNYVDKIGNVGFRDNSILVDYWIKSLPANQYSIKNGKLFKDSYLKKPVTIELEHYSLAKQNNNWSIPNGTAKGANVVIGATYNMNATYLGFHGTPGEYLRENPKLVEQMVNDLGYWFFPINLSQKETLSKGKTNELDLTWLNKGVAPAYHKYDFSVKLVKGNDKPIYEEKLSNIDNRTWMPGVKSIEKLSIPVDANVTSDSYDLKVKLYDPITSRNVKIAVDKKYLDADGYYTLATMKVN